MMWTSGFPYDLAEYDHEEGKDAEAHMGLNNTAQAFLSDREEDMAYRCHLTPTFTGRMLHCKVKVRTE